MQSERLDRSPTVWSEADSDPGRRRRRRDGRKRRSIWRWEDEPPIVDFSGGMRKGPDSSQDESLKLRLDLNLEVDIQVRARVHGDVQLSLL